MRTLRPRRQSLILEAEPGERLPSVERLRQAIDGLDLPARGVDLQLIWLTPKGWRPDLTGVVHKVGQALGRPHLQRVIAKTESAPLERPQLLLDIYWQEVQES